MKEDCSAGRLSLEGLESGPRDWSGTLPTDADFWSSDELDFIDPPMLQARVEGSADGSVHVTGRFTGVVRRTCRRCLEALERKIELPLDLWFEPAIESTGEEDGVVGLDPAAAELDVVPPLREELILALPEEPECVPACGGFCPSCGADLGIGTCDCAENEPDPRWDALRKLTKHEGP